SNQKAARATESGVFAEQIVGVEVKTRKGVVVVDKDEHIKPDANQEALSKLRPSFKKEGTVTAGNASGINDGAASLVVASEEAVNKHGLKPMARTVSWGVEGVEPTSIRLGPVPPIKQPLERAELAVRPTDLHERTQS